jgi:hypothetical protein
MVIVSVLFATLLLLLLSLLFLFLSPLCVSFASLTEGSAFVDAFAGL